MTRTPREVFADHGTRLGTGDLDTFVFRDGLISAQTVRHTLSPVPPEGALREGVETLRAAWRHGPLRLPRADLGLDRQLEVLPKPVHTTGIPIAVAGGAQQTPEWVAEHADASLNYPREPGALRLKTREWQQRTGGGKPYLTPMVLALQDDADAPARPIRLGLSTGRKALLDHLNTMADLGVAHVSFNLRPNDRPVDEVLHELAENVLPHFPTPRATPHTEDIRPAARAS
ncbi:hypothetical protein ACGFYV_05570 [Streptomyces sp. NPDC048297]|uniref:hypothetical protein n=1 Tax=Streptomyces sp. NPDC048297 TaxID=3365531 RepID=UPI003716CB17